MMNMAYRLYALLVILLGLSGCATYSDAVNSLAPERGRWQHDTYEIAYDSPFCPKPVAEVPEEVVVAEDLPYSPYKAKLYFLFGKYELTADSKTRFKTIYTDILQQNASEVVVVGHTDTVGSDEDNQVLSDKRAEAVTQKLINNGVKANTINASGLGERDLAVNTGDNVNEAKNRRVEISVR